MNIEHISCKSRGRIADVDVRMGRKTPELSDDLFITRDIGVLCWPIIRAGVIGSENDYDHVGLESHGVFEVRLNV